MLIFPSHRLQRHKQTTCSSFFAICACVLGKSEEEKDRITNVLSDYHMKEGKEVSGSVWV